MELFLYSVIKAVVPEVLGVFGNGHIHTIGGRITALGVLSKTI
jgi:hypothetical protein